MAENKPQQVIVSGATGFVGRHLVPLLLQHNYEVIAVARDLSKAKALDWYADVQFISADFHKGDISIDVKPDAGLIHLAWQGLPNYKSQFHLEENLPHNFEFVKSLVQQGVQQVLITGTCFEYGMKSGAISSTAKPDPDPSNAYAVAKDKLRQKLELLAEELPFSLQWARLFYMYGEGQNPNSLLSQLDSAIDKQSAEFNMSGGEQLRDYLPIAAVAQQLFDLYSMQNAGTYNICSGKPISVKALVEQRIAERKSDIKPNLAYYPYPDFEPMEFWGVRDIGETLYLPSLPNAPISSKKSEQSLAPMRLRYNEALKFLENEAFDSTLIDYSQNYENSQAFSQRFFSHMKDVLERLKQELPKGSLVVEVGCGKGDFVELVQSDGYFKVTGFDASYAGTNPVIEKRYLSADDRVDADIVVLRHVLEHVPQPHTFLGMLHSVFNAAKIYIEVPSYDWIIDNETYFDITYEHVNYFSQLALMSLFQDGRSTQGLLFDDQYQYVISDLASLNPAFSSNYDSKSWTFKGFDELFPGAVQTMEEISKLVKDKSLFIWGAATKGCLFLAHCAARKQLIEQVAFAVDVNPNKVGKFLPGSLVEIKSKQDFFKAAKAGDVLLIANPAYESEIVAELAQEKITQVRVKTL